MGAIGFVQFLRPDGGIRHLQIFRPAEVSAQARAVAEAGYRFEIEVLKSECLRLEVVAPEPRDGLPPALASEVVPNGPGVDIAVDKLVAAAFLALQRARGEVPAPGRGRGRL